MDEKKAFGLTIDEVAVIKKSVADWKDSNSPIKRKADGGNFGAALRAGSKLLCNDNTFISALKFEGDL